MDLMPAWWWVGQVPSATGCQAPGADSSSGSRVAG